MIDRDSFIEVITRYKGVSKFIDGAKSVLGIDITESSLVEAYWSLFDMYLEAYFNSNGIDDILWWLLEKQKNPEFKMWDDDDNEIPTETIDDLWNIVKSNRI